MQNGSTHPYGDRQSNLITQEIPPGWFPTQDMEGKHGSDPRGVSKCDTAIFVLQRWATHTPPHTDILKLTCAFSMALTDFPLRKSFIYTTMTKQNRPTTEATETLNISKSPRNTDSLAILLSVGGYKSLAHNGFTWLLYLYKWGKEHFLIIKGSHVQDIKIRQRKRATEILGGAVQLLQGMKPPDWWVFRAKGKTKHRGMWLLSQEG